MNKIKQLFLNPGSSFAYAVITCIFTIVPEEYFSDCIVLANNKLKKTDIIFLNRLLLCALVFIVCTSVYWLYLKKRKKIKISGKNYIIQVEYGNILRAKGKKVISFDECFSTNVGDAPSDIKPNSICGQYLKNHFPIDIQKLINNAGIKPMRGKSQYNNNDKYLPGTIVPNEEFLLVAFAKLDKNGLGHLTYDEYIECLNVLWEQIDLYHGTDDVFIPILGSGITTRFDKELTQQELLDIIICSYRLSPRKLKMPTKLHIVCKESEGFSINNTIGV